MKTTKNICYNCGKEMLTDKQYRWHDDYLGDFAIDCQPEEYSFCECGEERLAYSLCLRIEQEEQDRIAQAIMNMANNDFKRLENIVVSGRELESIMHVSRQAICKNGKLKTLVYHIKFKGKIYYLYESVMRFLETRDGRYDLSPYIKKTATTMDESAMKDITHEEIASPLVDLAQNSTNLIQNHTHNYRKNSKSYSAAGQAIHKESLTVLRQTAHRMCHTQKTKQNITTSSGVTPPHENKTIYFQPGLSTRQDSRPYAHTQFHTDLNRPGAEIFYAASPIIDEANLVLAKAKSINTSFNIGEK